MLMEGYTKDRYGIGFDRLVGLLLPRWLHGRDTVLFLQSCLRPLQTVADAFREWAYELRIDASMTSQTGRFEWYLSRRLSHCFADPSARIVIESWRPSGSVFYRQDSRAVDRTPDPVARLQSEGGSMALYSQEQDPGHSFIVYVPAAKEGMKKELVAGLNAAIERYRLANKTYKIVFI